MPKTTAKMTQPAETPEKAPAPSLPIAPNSQVKITVPWTTVDPAYQKALRRYARDVKIDGFRKGKAPLHLVEGMVKQTALIEYVLQVILPDAYAAVIQAEDKHPISQPEVDPVKIDKGSDWELIAYFAETPEIKLTKYDEAVKKGIQEAEQEIATQEKTLQENTAEQLTEKTQPINLTAEQKDELKTRFIFKQLVELFHPQIPELLVRREADRELRRLVEQLEQHKLSVERYLESRQMDAEQLRLEYLSAAVTSLQLEFILAEIGKAEKITVDEKEIDDTLDRVFGEKLSDTQRQNNEYRSYVFSSVVKQKIAKHLLSLA